MRQIQAMNGTANTTRTVQTIEQYIEPQIYHLIKREQANKN